ncbi:MAG: hypothetical protein JWM98_2857 [Thermoleophilia bacterium]|nr:hypothetical protein [Thermoleophilia bacterium]
MPTIEHHPDPIPTRGGAPRGFLRRTWPVALPLAILVLLAVRVAVDGDAGAHARRPAQAAAAAERLGTRSFDGLQLEVPAGWATLERTADHVAWGSADRTHTVTLAATEASLLPLSGVVASVSRDSSSAVPGARPVGRPVRLDLDGRAPHGDTAVLARFRIDAGAGRSLEVRQVWRRDLRAGRDVVATWTSSDGAWPAPPAASIPRAEAVR